MTSLARPRIGRARHAAGGHRARDRAGGGGREHAFADRHPQADRRRASGGDGVGARREDARAKLCDLTERDREIALAVAEGKANATIAGELHLSVATVKSHVSSVLSKLGLDNRVQIALLVQDAQRV